MPSGANPSFSDFIDRQRPQDGSGSGLASLLDGVQTACRSIASAIARGPLISRQDDTAAVLQSLAVDVMTGACRGSGLGALISDRSEALPGLSEPGYVLVFSALDGASTADIGVAMGFTFSILSASRATALLQPGSCQLAAGVALYGPCSLMLVTLGQGVHGFTLDPRNDAYLLTHPDLRIPPRTTELSVDSSAERFWEHPVRHYLNECVEGAAGQRRTDFAMRWIDSLAADACRVLMRGGVLMVPRDRRGRDRVRLLHTANPLAMLAEQAGGAASTGRQRILEIEPTAFDQRVPLFIGSEREVRRIERYHELHDRGDPLVFETPLFRRRSLFLGGLPR